MSSSIDNKTDSTNTNELSIENINELKDKEKVQMDSISLSISAILEELLKQNKQLSSYKKKIYEQSKMVFSCHKKPKISILEYINRIIKYTYLEKSSLIVSLIYLDRICQNDILLTDYNIHRLLLISIIISIKINEDKIFGNNYYAEVGGISIKEFNSIESDFVNFINYYLFVTEEEYFKYKMYLENYFLKIKK
jgi:hypothetical protein